MIRHPEYSRARLAQTSARLRSRIHPETQRPDELLVGPRVDRITWQEAQTLEYEPVELGTRFGPLFATFWFRMRATVPDGWRGRRVDLLWDSASEATLWLDGRVAQGLNKHHNDATLLARADGGEPLDLQVEIACNGLFGKQEAPFELHRAELALFDEDAWEIFHDFETLRALEAEGGDRLDASFAGLLRSALGRFCDVVDDDPDDARALLAELYEHRNGTRAHEIGAIGHAHIDTAWLWPLAESYRKCLRTFSTAVAYMDDYPEYRFACSQAVQYAWVKERNPELYDRIRAKVESGQFVPVGGSWVEPDLNIPSGESLVRQLLHGQRFFEAEFGRRCREFWAPDAFGYNGQLPQLMRSAGITRFLTQKLSWNRFTKPDSHTFLWEGADGSQVLVHFPPADTYSSEANVRELVKTMREYKDHEHSRRSLLVFGHGDGGGGPTKEMLETIRRAGDLQGLPRTQPTTSEEFFSALESEDDPRPVVVGELYLEYHRGTYTSQAFVKRGNRRAEQLLHDAEFLAAARGGDYPRAELDRLWKLLLLQQFHDILPGSSIRLVYEDAERDFAELFAGAAALVPAGQTPVNTVCFARRELTEHPAGGLVFLAAPPYGVAAEVDADDQVTVDGLTLENGQLRATLAADGTLVSLIEKSTGRETLAFAGNRLELYDDDPVAFDAWDVDPAHLGTRRDAAPAESYAVVATGPLRAEVRFERPIGKASRMTQTVRLDAGARRLEFHTTVDWLESHVFLKVAFPLAVRSPNATYETPFGYAERPTHYSTAWDRARYEVPGQRWADLSEHGFGAAVLTDSKYGYSCHDGDLRISLLRSPKSPDPEADMRHHEFAYAIVPHPGGWREAGIVAEGVRFNAPLRWTGDVVADGHEPGFASVDDPNLVLDTIKVAEDSDALVLRLYEAHGGRGTARVRLSRPFTSAARANLLEDEEEQLSLERRDGGRQPRSPDLVLPYRPHEVITVVVR